jgi:threonylcarbamoyladenosine tRNA methylthiotransferase MtaB
MEETSFVINNIEKDSIAKFIKNYFFSNLPNLPESVDYISGFSAQTRPFIKIQDGCKSFCTYCVIPHTRPIMRSLKKESVAKQINLLSDQGYKEIVLTGIHLGYYGEDLKEDIDFIGLLKYLEVNTSIERVRISSIDPHEITKEFVDIVASSKKIQNQLHIALQYGDDKILKLMKREYTVKQLLENLEYANKKIPNLLYGFDIIVGFPYETEKSFENTKNLLLQTKPGYLHVFPYSKRPLTEAMDYSNHVDPPIMKKRAKILRELGKKLKKERMIEAIGSVDSLLIERKLIDNDIEYFRGHTSSFFDVVVEKDKDLSDNIIIDVKLEKILNDNIIIASVV